LLKPRPALAPIVRPLIDIREATPADAQSIGRIMYEAFGRFHDSRGFPRDFPSIDAATGLAAAQIADPLVYGVVAVAEGQIVGSNFLTEGDPIRGVGPISVDPDLQDAGVGRLLMQAVLKRGAEARGVRLLQDSFNVKSMALYASLGFRAREPLAVLTGRARDTLDPGLQVRPMTPADLAAADALARHVHGFSRGAELRTALAQGTPVVLERNGRLVAYMTMPSLWLLNHAVAETETDLCSLILGASRAGPIGFLLPIRRAELFRWALGQGFAVVKPMTLMTRGDYREPDGAWLPSVMY
jgi:predicted N-acetyltransferase YhbS